MASKQRTFGQFETPPDVADLLLAFCLRRAGDRVLDPSCGNGALLERAARWQAWLDAKEEGRYENLWGVELEEEAASIARQRLPRTNILHQSFFT
jgi:type I restriction-modification system DNA methylase subunit